MSNPIPILQALNLGRCVSQRWLWRGVSFQLNAGDRLGVMGPSGVGKSLLLRSLIGLDLFDEGEVILGGQSLSEWKMPDLRRHCLYLAQTPGLIEGTVEDNLQAIFQLKGHRDRTYSRDLAVEKFQKMGRGEAFLGQSVDRLSGGERQLLNVVRGLLIQPSILLLDEPTAALDMETTNQVEQVSREWVQGGNGRAYLWISHSPNQIQRMTNRQLDLSGFVP